MLLIFLLCFAVASHALTVHDASPNGSKEKFLKRCLKICDEIEKFCKKRGDPPKVINATVALCVKKCNDLVNTSKEAEWARQCKLQYHLCLKYVHDVDECWQNYHRCLKHQKKPTPAPVPPHVGGCGKPDIPGIRVIAGKTAVRGSWPWQGLVMYYGHPVCGGALIAPQWVVTSAHCVYKYETSGWFSVKFGEHDRKSFEGTEVRIRVDKVIRHPQYDKLTNDIALMKLEHPVKLNKYISPVCLPTGNVPAGTRCYITGWGMTHFPGDMTRFLQQGVLPVVTNEKCYEKNKHLVPKPVTNDMICGGSGGSDPQNGCHGDSGGPYVCQIGDVWQLHGTVSYGSPSCNSTEAYTVFSRTFYFIDWITKNMQKKQSIE